MIRSLVAQTAAALTLSLAVLPCGSAAALPATILHGSVRVPDATGLTIGRATVVRALSRSEMAQPIRFSVTLRMRNFDDLEERIAQGGTVSAAEMEEKYLPLKADYDSVAAWLASQGFKSTLTDRVHMTVFVTGTVSAVSSALGVRFARVQVSDGEYTSAVSEPTIPAELLSVVLSVDGLQPEFRMRHVRTTLLPQPADLVGKFIYITPDNIASAYNVPDGANGSGVTIAIIGEADVNASDLTTFWSTTGVSQSAANVTTIDVDGGPGGNVADSLLFEAALDVEWAGAMAPAAKIRYYVSPNALENLTQVLNDLPSNPSMTVVSSSFGNTESEDGNGILRQFSQTMATLAAAGVSVLDSSGDAGSNPNGSISAGSYLASAPLGVTYPASDPNVTGVGGTTVTYTGNWQVESEVVWNQVISSTPSASGGGVSGFFAKPSWQTGGSVLAGESMRCIPDIAALSDANLDNVNVANGGVGTGMNDGVFLVYTSGGKQTEVAASGTSLSCPIWAGFTALINQARTAQGLGPIGLLNPHLYPLGGSAAFNDITSGNNGFYSAGPGFDLCTGLGSPNVANLVAALAASSQASTSRLANISTRADVETGANILIAGTAISGAAGTTKSILVRGIGPGLQQFSVTGTLSSVVLGVYDSAGDLIASDTGWGNAPVAGTSSVNATFRAATGADMLSVGAFALTTGSGDSAMVLTLPVGTYTVQISGASSGTGVALAEVYELSNSVPELLANLSSRAFVGTGGQIAISGFVVHGTASETVLVRGVGPTLATSPFNISGALVQPVLTLEDSGGTAIASDTGWGNAPVAGSSKVAASYRQATASDMSAVGAFALPANSGDSAIVVTLPPGNYTAELAGANNMTGTALVEVYQLSN